MASAVPLSGCSATVVASDASPAPDASADVTTDAVRMDVAPVDVRDCARREGPPGGCSTQVIYPCGSPPRTASGTLDCAAICPSMGGGGAAGCTMTNSADPEAVTVECTYCVIGRRVAGFAPSRAVGGDVVGRFYAAASQLEAASVVAFERLASELTAYAAPEALIADARSAADDERRHTVATREVAEARGATPWPLPELSARVRSVRDMAIENAVEGCVRETFGALVATWQSQHARCGDIARAMDTIAYEETRHAALAWAVAAWLDEVSITEDREAVREARARAARELMGELSAPVDVALVRDAGMPTPAEAQRLATEMFAALGLV